MFLFTSKSACFYSPVISARLDDLIIGLEALGLLANMNWERKEARAQDGAH